MAKEYIERDAVMQKFADHVKRSNNSDYAPTPTWNQAVQIVERIPAADVRPVVRHGHWVEVEVKELAYYKMMIASMRCDQCGRYHNEVYHYGGPTEMAKYCGFCGARMDGDGDV